MTERHFEAFPPTKRWDDMTPDERTHFEMLLDRFVPIRWMSAEDVKRLYERPEDT